MKINYCTLFNSAYLSRGLALHESLSQTAQNFHLYIIAFDKKAEDTLKFLNLKNVTVISLEEFEDPELLKVKPTRTMGEYCWTSTPSSVLYCLKNFNLDQCTYIDADLYFYSDPKILLDEMTDKDCVLITEHRYTKKYDQAEASGKYCVQFVSFKNNEDGLKVLNWWRDACLEWCYARLEDGKFGDQKYLDNWTEQFGGVHVLDHLGGGVAPWNVQQYRADNKGNIIELTEVVSGKKFPLVFFHFHALKIYQNHFDLGNYELTSDIKNNIYKKYTASIESIDSKLRLDFDFNWHLIGQTDNSLKAKLRLLKRRVLGIHNLITSKSELHG